MHMSHIGKSASQLRHGIDLIAAEMAKLQIGCDQKGCDEFGSDGKKERMEEGREEQAQEA